MALEKRVSLDATVIARLCKERDELLQTVERLHSEHGIEANLEKISAITRMGPIQNIKRV